MSASQDSSRHAHHSARDSLTATFTRQYFLKLLTNEQRFALETSKPFCICLVDLDQLRKVNEQHGLDAGDALLARTAETIRGTLDEPQWQNLRMLIGRYDGDSFILLMPGCRLDRAEQFAHALRDRLEDIGRELEVTASFAVAALKLDDSIDELLARTEKTMCLAKQFGGDSVEVSRTAELTRDLASVTRLPVAWQGRPAKSA